MNFLFSALRRVLALTPGLIACAVAGCDGNEGVVVDGSGEPEPGGTPSAPGDPPARPLYAIAGTSFGPEGNTSYVALVPSLARGTRIDYGQVLELAGGASVFGADGDGLFALGYEEEPTITRFDVSAEGRFVERERLSLMAHGLDHMWRDPGLVPFIARDKAYVIDAETSTVVIWNPDAMELRGSFSIDGVADAMYPDTAFEPDPTRRGDQLLIAATHSNESASAPFSTLIVLDLENDRVVSVAREERCGGLWNSAQASNGDVYYATGTWDAARHRALGEAVAAEPCLVRVKAGETAFDPSFFVPLADLTAGRAAGGLVSGAGDAAYIKALDESLLPSASDFDSVWSQDAWQWWRLDLGAEAAALPVETIAPAAAGGGELFVEGRAHALNVAADFAETTLFDMSPAEGPEEMLTVRGWPYGIVRVR